MVQLWELRLHLFPLEHVVLSLLADRGDEVELPGHGVGLLGWEREAESGASQARGSLPAPQPTPPFTMISMALQREVPQYMAIPWLMT